jgi:hypothetical protein
MLVSYCADVGSIKDHKFGWARVDQSTAGHDVSGGTSMSGLLSGLIEDIHSGHQLTIGIEAPLFVPVPFDEKQLGSRRNGEEDRCCFAAPGACVTVLGMAELAYLLTKIQASCQPSGVKFDLNWKQWPDGNNKSMLLWEAFVSGAAKMFRGDAKSNKDSHMRDAATGAVAFMTRFRRKLKTDVTVDQPRDAFSITGALLLWAGLSSDIGLLRTQTLVVKPNTPYPGKIDRR